MGKISLRIATVDDESFALSVTDACMRSYAEQTWGKWNGDADFDLATDKIIQSDNVDIGLIGIEPRDVYWWLDKLYILPSHQNRGIGAVLIGQLKDDAAFAGVSIRLSVLAVNPARRFYERHGFRLTEIVGPRQHMEWRT